MTAEKQAAAARLRDFATVNDPNANPYAKQYAGERLDDYNMSKFVGPLPVDPVLGTDARQQAKTRLEFQQKLESGLLGTAPMSPDAATAYLDSSETQARAMVLNRAEQQLRNMGLSDAGVMTVLKGLGSLSDSIGTGVEQYGTSKETGKHALAGLSKADAELFTKWGGRVGWVGNIAQLVIAGIEYPDNDWNPNEELGKATGGVLGSVLGGMGAGAAVGSFGGPFTAAGAAIIGGLLGGFAGSDIGGGIGSQLRPATRQPRRRRRRWQLVAGGDHRCGEGAVLRGHDRDRARHFDQPVPVVEVATTVTGIDPAARLLDGLTRRLAAVVRCGTARLAARPLRQPLRRLVVLSVAFRFTTHIKIRDRIYAYMHDSRRPTLHRR